jgi:hypothetical protein
MLLAVLPEERIDSLSSHLLLPLFLGGRRLVDVGSLDQGTMEEGRSAAVDIWEALEVDVLSVLSFNPLEELFLDMVEVTL